VDNFFPDVKIAYSIDPLELWARRHYPRYESIRFF
jgi:hypothetical protein